MVLKLPQGRPLPQRTRLVHLLAEAMVHAQTRYQDTTLSGLITLPVPLRPAAPRRKGAPAL